MGITVELMLMAPGETPEQTISRCTDGDTRVVTTDAVTTPWTPDEGWQIEFHRSGVMFRRRGGVPDSIVSPAQILRAFCGTPAVLHEDDDNWWTLPATVPDDVSMYG